MTVAPQQQKKIIPGPPARPLIGHLPELAGDRLQFFTHLGQTYGDVSRYHLGMKTLYFVNHPELLHGILTHPKVERSTLVRRLLSSFVDGLLSQEGKKHLQQRRLMQPAFHKQRLEHYADLMVTETGTQLESWQDGRTLDVVEEMKDLTFRIVSRALFSDSGRASREVGIALDQLQQSFGRKFRLYAALPNWIPMVRTLTDRQVVRTFTRVVQTILEERHREPGDRGDLLSMLLEARDVDGSRMSEQDIVGQSVTLLTAGHETTANTLSWAFYLLARHPHVLAKLQHELDTVLEGRPPMFADLARLPYTEMVVQETLRLYPVAWFTERSPKETITVGGYTFPAGCTLAASAYVMQRDARFFEEPEQFMPERFSSERRTSIPKHAYVPFGAGVHTCIGNAFALMEARLILARVLQQFVVQLEPDYVPRIHTDITLGIDNGLPLRLIIRRPAFTIPSR